MSNTNSWILLFHLHDFRMEWKKCGSLSLLHIFPLFMYDPYLHHYISAHTNQCFLFSFVNSFTANPNYCYFFCQCIINASFCFPVTPAWSLHDVNPSPSPLVSAPYSPSTSSWQRCTRLVVPPDITRLHSALDWHILNWSLFSRMNLFSADVKSFVSHNKTVLNIVLGARWS